MAFTNHKPRATRRRVVPTLDLLEGRVLLAAGNVIGGGSSSLIQSDYYNFFLAPQAKLGAKNATPISGTYGATQLEKAYGTTALGAANQGQGQTIGIVDVFSDSAVISDVNTYSSVYGLPQFNTTGGPTFTVAQPLGTAGASPTSGGNDTSVETSLDVDMAHAMAPQANILMVFVPAGSSLASEIANLLKGADYAGSQGASVVSISYGTSESSLGASNVTSDSTNYLSPTVLPNTVVTISTGDSSSTSFPATSPNVIAVGGTSLHTVSASGTYGYETAWGGVPSAGAGGGGPSTNFSAPSYQYNNGVSTSTGKRFTPDVSMSADDVMATALYDSYDNSGWTAAGGTSEASPLFAGVVAIAQQEIAAGGNSTLNSVALNTDLYAIYNSANYATDFHDISIGQNGNVSGSGRVNPAGYAAINGYDEATGIGSPNAANLIPMLAPPSPNVGPVLGGTPVIGVVDANPGLVGNLIPLTLPSVTPVGTPATEDSQDTSEADLEGEMIPLTLVPVAPALELTTDGNRATKAKS